MAKEKKIKKTKNTQSASETNKSKPAAESEITAAESASAGTKAGSSAAEPASAGTKADASAVASAETTAESSAAESAPAETKGESSAAESASAETKAESSAAESASAETKAESSAAGATSAVTKTESSAPESKSAETAAESSATAAASSATASAATGTAVQSNPATAGSVPGNSGNSGNYNNASSNGNSNPPAKKSHKGLAAALICGAVILGAGGWYCYEAQGYKDKFLANTTINGIDVSGMTLEEAEAAIAEKVEDYNITVSLPDGSSQTLTGQDVGMKFASNGDVEDRLSHQIIYFWGGKYLGITFDYDAAENYTIDEAAVKTAVEALPEFDETKVTKPVDAKMQLNASNQVEIVPEVEGNELDEDKVVEAITAAVQNKEESTSIDDSYYLRPTVYSDDATLNAEVADLNKFLSTKITITLHDNTAYTIDAATLKTWLTQDEETGIYTIDDSVLKEKSTEIASDIAAKDNFSSDTYPFKSTLSGTINIACSTYGCTVDEASTADEIYNDLTAGGESTGTPVYSEEISDPIGSTYAEVDIANQMVYMYVDGNCVVSSACVSGTDTDPEKMSDRGLFYVTWKATDYTMYGPSDENGNPSYASFVNYAVFYNGGEALHDAPWRDTFGGDIYLYSGSHGCINMPYDAAQTVYNYSYEGMPVIVF